ncbi:hypothetical protein GGH93_001754 [Coemansia aciculifera]|nr:hypothetical protein GGH93_001754 [Coemansia aciculifera]
MDNSKQLVTRSRHALTCMPHNGSASSFNQQGTDDVQVSGTLPIRYAQIVIKEPGTAEPKRAKRKRITAEQLRDLTAVFENTDTPTHDIREVLSKKLGMTNREVQVWFQNRRAKYNRQRLEQQRQMRTNAAIMFSAGMVAARAPLQTPLPLQLIPYAHLPPQSSYPPAILTRPPTSTIDSSGGQPGDGHFRKCPIDASPVDVTRAAIAGNALLQLSEARPAVATSAFARPLLGDSHRYDSHSNLGAPHMQTPALTSASAVAYCAYSESPSASPYRPSTHGPSSRIANEECAPQHQHKQQLVPHTLSGALLPTRRNTVSSYQSTSRSVRSGGADHTERLPLVYPVSPPATASGPVCMIARDRYRPDTPASHYHRQCRYSTNRSPSPFQSQYRQLSTAFPSAYDLPAAAGRGVKLPSIQAILADVEHVSSGESKATSIYSHPLSRSRAYTSPPLGMVEPQLRTGRKDMLATSGPHMPPQPQVSANSFPPWALVGESDGQHNSCTSSGAQDYSPCVNYYHESPVDEAKLAIDMLATAAVSVSSARSSCSLPHLTPLSEFSMRAGSQLQCSPTHTPSLQPQEYQTAENKTKSSRSWRPW